MTPTMRAASTTVVGLLMSGTYAALAAMTGNRRLTADTMAAAVRG